MNAQRLTLPTAPQPHAGARVVWTATGLTGRIVGRVLDWPTVTWDKGPDHVAGWTLCTPPSWFEQGLIEVIA